MSGYNRRYLSNNDVKSLVEVIKLVSLIFEDLTEWKHTFITFPNGISKKITQNEAIEIESLFEQLTHYFGEADDYMSSQSRNLTWFDDYDLYYGKDYPKSISPNLSKFTPKKHVKKVKKEAKPPKTYRIFIDMSDKFRKKLQLVYHHINNIEFAFITHYRLKRLEGDIIEIELVDFKEVYHQQEHSHVYFHNTEFEQEIMNIDDLSLKFAYSHSHYTLLRDHSSTDYDEAREFMKLYGNDYISIVFSCIDNKPNLNIFFEDRLYNYSFDFIEGLKTESKQAQAFIDNFNDFIVTQEDVTNIERIKTEEPPTHWLVVDKVTKWLLGEE